MNIKIPGYTLHGDYYLADKIIPKNQKEAIKMKEKITLPNGKTVIARILSKEELETIPREERKRRMWYWTSTHYNGEYGPNTLYDNDYAWYVKDDGDFYCFSVYDNVDGGARLGFKNPFLHSDKKEDGLAYKDREFQKINNKNTIKEEILEIYNKCFNY